MTITGSTVEVVTTGTDWPAIVAAISTGVVGLAGIGGTIWSGTRRINTESERVRLAEKRRIYAAYHTALDRLWATWISAEDIENIQALRSFLRDADTTAASAASEVGLIASASVRYQAIAIQKELQDFTYSPSRGDVDTFKDPNAKKARPVAGGHARRPWRDGLNVMRGIRDWSHSR